LPKKEEDVYLIIILIQKQNYNFNVAKDIFGKLFLSQLYVEVGVLNVI